MRFSYPPILSVIMICFLCLIKIDVSAAQEAATQVDQKDDAELRWKQFSEKEFGKVRFSAPTIIAVMLDLCPGCKAKRDALWSNPKLKRIVLERKMNLFNGNAAEDAGMDELIKTKFKVKKLPVVIIQDKTMAGDPIILNGIPEPDAVINAILKKYPMSK